MPRIVSRRRDYRAESVRIRRMRMTRSDFRKVDRILREKAQLHRLRREMSNVSH
jgi:hypothetical protein